MLYVCKLEYCPENVRFTDILKAPRNLYDLGGDFVRKAVRESMFGKAPFYGRKLFNDLDNWLKVCYNHISNFS